MLQVLFFMRIALVRQLFDLRLRFLPLNFVCVVEKFCFLQLNYKIALRSDNFGGSVEFFQYVFNVTPHYPVTIASRDGGKQSPAIRIFKRVMVDALFN